MDESGYIGALMRHGFMPRIDEELARVSARNQYKLIYRYFRKYRKRVIPELYVLSVLFVTLGLYSGGINNSSTLGIFSLHISLLIIFFIKLVLIDAQAYNFFKQHLRSSVLECTHCERVIKSTIQSDNYTIVRKTCGGMLHTHQCGSTDEFHDDLVPLQKPC